MGESLTRGKRNLNPQAWRVFQAAFEVALSRLDDVAEGDIEAKILKELPPAWRSSVMKEMARRARNTYWIRLPRPSPLGKEELAALLSNYLDLEDLTIEEQRHFFLVNCKSAHKQDVALTMDGWVTPGGYSMFVGQPIV